MNAPTVSEHGCIICVDWPDQELLMRKKTVRIIGAVIVIGVAWGVASRMRDLRQRSKVRISVEKDASDISGLAGQKKIHGINRDYTPINEISDKVNAKRVR